MPGILAKAALATLTVMGAATAAIGPAAADGGIRYGLYIGTDEPTAQPVWGDDWGDRDYDRPRYAPRPPRDDTRYLRLGRDAPPTAFSGFCAPQQAVRQAGRDGLRRPFIESMTPRRVVVAGYRYGEYDRVVFRNRPGCPYAD